MTLKMIHQVFLVGVLLSSSWCSGREYTSSRDVQSRVGPTLSTFKTVSRERQEASDGSYRFSFSLPDHERSEERAADGEVEGSFAFVAPEGEEFALKYDAGQKGFRPESESLPVGPTDTDAVQNARDAHLKRHEETISYLKAFGTYSEEKGEVVQPDSSEEIRSRVVRPKSHEGYNSRVVKAEPQRAVKPRVVKQESQEKTRARVAEPQRAVKPRVVKQESQEKTRARVARPKAREGYNRRVAKTESHEEVNPIVVKPKAREEYRRRIVKPESEEEVRVRVVKPDSREAYSYAEDDEDLDAAESHEVEVRVARPKSREEYRRRVVRPESVKEVKPRVVKPIIKNIVEIKKVEVVEKQEEEEEEEEVHEHEHHEPEHEHEHEHEHGHEHEHEEELSIEITDEDLEAAYNANVFESARNSVFNRITPKALKPSSTSAPETNNRTRAPRITEVPKISGPYFHPIRK